MELPFKFIIFDLDSTNPVDVAKNLKEAQALMANLKGSGRYAVKPFKKYFSLLQKQDPVKYTLLVEIAKKKVYEAEDDI